MTKSVRCGCKRGGSVYCRGRTRLVGFRSRISLLACTKLRLVSMGKQRACTGRKERTTAGHAVRLERNKTSYANLLSICWTFQRNSPSNIWTLQAYGYCQSMCGRLPCNAQWQSGIFPERADFSTGGRKALGSSCDPGAEPIRSPKSRYYFSSHGFTHPMHRKDFWIPQWYLRVSCTWPKKTPHVLPSRLE